MVLRAGPNPAAAAFGGRAGGSYFTVVPASSAAQGAAGSAAAGGGRGGEGGAASSDSAPAAGPSTARVYQGSGFDVDFAYDAAAVRSEVEAAITGLSGDDGGGRFRSSRDKRTQRAVAREVARTVRDGILPATQVRVRRMEEKVEGWGPRLALDSLRSALAAGLQTHLEYNPVAGETVGVDVGAGLADAAAASKMSAAEKVRTAGRGGEIPGGIQGWLCCRG
jgi:hypothetical protein